MQIKYQEAEKQVQLIAKEFSSHLVRTGQYQLTNHPKNIYTVQNIWLHQMCLPNTGHPLGQSKEKYILYILWLVLSGLLPGLVGFSKCGWRSLKSFLGGHQGQTILIRLAGCCVFPSHSLLSWGQERGWMCHRSDSDTRSLTAPRQKERQESSLLLNRHQ